MKRRVWGGIGSLVFQARSRTASAISADASRHGSSGRCSADGRTQKLSEALGARVMDIAKTMAEAGKEVVATVREDGEPTVGIHELGR